MMGILGLYKTKKWAGCHHLLLVYDTSKLSTVYVVKSELAPSVLVLSVLDNGELTARPTVWCSTY